MFPSPDICVAVHTLSISDWEVEYSQIQAGCPKDEIKISKRVQLAEKRTVRSDDFVLILPEDLCPAQGILDILPQQKRKTETEEPVTYNIEIAHRLIFHRIY